MTEKKEWGVGDQCLWFDDWGHEGSKDGDPEPHWYPGAVTRVYQICLNGPEDFWDVVDVLLDSGHFHTAVWAIGIKERE